MSQLRNILIATPKYSPLNYVEMDGTNHINTGIPAVDNTVVEVTFSKNWETLGSGRCYIFWQGEGDYGGVRYYNDNATVLRGGYGAQTWRNASSQSIPEPSTLYFAKSDYKLNGTSFSGFNLGGNFSGNYIIGNDHTDVTQLPVRIWGYKIWDASANLVFDAIPLTRLSDSLVGMLDRVSNTFFGNANFIGG